MSRWLCSDLAKTLWISALLSAPLVALAANDVRSIQVDKNDDGVNVTINLAQATEASFFTLSDPERAVIDLKSAQSAAGLTLTPQGIVNKIRLGARPDGGMRIVLDVNARVDLNPVTSKGNRIEVEIRPTHAHRAVTVLNPASGNSPPPLNPVAAAPVANATAIKAAESSPGSSGEVASNAAASATPVAKQTAQGAHTEEPAAVSKSKDPNSGDKATAANAAADARTASAGSANRSMVDEVQIRESAGQTVIDILISGNARPVVSTQDRKLEVDASPLELGSFPVPSPVGVVSGFEVKPNARGGLKLQFQLQVPTAFRSNYLNEGASQKHRLIITLDAAAAVEPSPPTAAVASVGVQASGLDLSHHHNRPYVISVDAGHGGEDPGALGHRGTREKDVTLAIARELAARLNQQSGIHAVLTRDTDVFLPLRERIRRARVAQADLFVSIHADAVQNSTATGASVYVLSEHGASSEAAKWLADRENAADLIGGVKLENKDKMLASVLLDLSQSAAMSMSMAAGERVLAQLNTVGELHKTQIQQAGFVVLKSPDIPSMLIESAYITNPGEEERLKDPIYQAKLADAIVNGIKQFFKENATPGARAAKL